MTSLTASDRKKYFLKARKDNKITNPERTAAVC